MGKDRGDGQEAGDSKSSAQALFSSIPFFLGGTLVLFFRLDFLGKMLKIQLFGNLRIQLLKQGFAATHHC